MSMTTPPAGGQNLLLPNDAFNAQLIGHVHPPDWVNPEPTERYNIVVIGAGTAGLVTAAVSAGLGARVALIERHLMGGDCLNVGCVPSKGVIRAARAWAAAANGADFGLRLPASVQHDFGAAMERMRRLRARISQTDSAHRYKNLGVAVFIGEGRFTGPDTIKVDGATLTFRRAVICTGARAVSPPIPGLQETGCLTSETVFSLTELPRRLAIVGAGPIGCELAQTFARFGSKVTLLERIDHILPREDLDAAAVVQNRMARDGVRFAFGATITRAARRNREKVLTYSCDGRACELVVDEILVGVGRAPNVEGLGLETAGVKYDKTGVKVDTRLRTSNPNIYAAGDICFAFKFTHTADAMGKIVVQNALFPHPLGLGTASTDSLIIPWCTYTEPEIAHVGMHARDAEAAGIEVETFTQNLNEVDRAILDGEDEGFARVHVKKGTDRILGATIVSANAGNMISEVSVAMKARVGLGTIGGTIHPYPTQADVLRRVANVMRKARFSQTQKSILSRWFAWVR